MSILRIVRGLPGSGKSTFAKKFGVAHFEADMYHIQDDEYKWIGSRTKLAHEWCYKSVHDCMVTVVWM